MRLSLYVAYNASFLKFSPAEIAAACLLLSMRFSISQANGLSGTRFDPLLIWDKKVEEATGLIFDIDIKPVYNILEERVKA